MVVVLDSYMGMFLPRDVAARITNFMAGDIVFPFIEGDEIMATFYLFGKDKGVVGASEAQTAADLAQRAVTKSLSDIAILRNARNRLNTDFIKQDYTKRALQISIELRNEASLQFYPINRRVATDPTILSACFCQHVAYYNQECFFELFGPFTENKIPKPLLKKLEGRMLLVGYNAADVNSLPSKNTLIPFLDWIGESG